MKKVVKAIEIELIAPQGLKSKSNWTTFHK